MPEGGTLGVDPKLGKTDDGNMPPVIHVDTDAPLYSDIDGSLITDKLWGLYYKPDFCFSGVQGGSMPARWKRIRKPVKVDPYGPESPDFVVGDEFARRVVFDAGLLPEAVSKGSIRCTRKSLGRHRRVYAGQFPGVRRHFAKTVTSSRIRITDTR